MPSQTLSQYVQYPTEPPPVPSTILQSREQYETALYQRRFLPLPKETDTPMRTLYRLYEAIVLDWNIGLRNEIEYFWRKAAWSVHDIPDPKDSDPARYAILASIPHLLVEAFNHNIELGLPRDAPAIMSWDEIEEVKTRKKVFETVPEWVNRVPALTETLRLPHYVQANGHELDCIHDANDERASEPFKAKNILIWHPHILFI